MRKGSIKQGSIGQGSVGQRTVKRQGADTHESGPETAPATPPRNEIEAVRRGRRARANRRAVILAAMVVATLGLAAAALMVGTTSYPLADTVAVLLGEKIPGASYAIGRVRLPRMVLAVVAGMCFGLGGVTFQTMLRNPLASPDIIGISAGASTAAVFGIVVLGLGGTSISLFAIVAGLTVAVLVYALAHGSGAAGARLILVGIGIAAMMSSLTTFLLRTASPNDLQLAMRWLAGSLNGASWTTVIPVAVALALCGPLLLALSRDIANLQLGDDMAGGLGMRVERSRLLLVVLAVAVIAFATAATGPIAFVAFLSGPIAVRIVGPHGSPLLPAAIIGAALVLAGDLVGQFAFGTRYPVGVVTGALGAPFLLYLIIRSNRREGSL